MPLNCPLGLELCSECRHLWPGQVCHVNGLTPIRDILTVEERLEILEKEQPELQPVPKDEIKQLRATVNHLQNKVGKLEEAAKNRKRRTGF